MVAAIQPVGGGNNVLSRFSGGQTIGPDSAFNPFGVMDSGPDEGDNTLWGVGNGPHYMGMRFTMNNQNHYGWVKLHLNPRPPAPLNIPSAAYETQADIPITTAPEPGAGLVLIAVAALTLARRRLAR